MNVSRKFQLLWVVSLVISRDVVCQTTTILSSQIPSLVIEDPCGVDPSLPSYSDEVYGSEAILPDGDLETADSFLGGFGQKLYLDPFVLGLVCSASSPSTVPPSLTQFVNETAVVQECNKAINELENLPGSAQFALSYTAAATSFGDQVLDVLLQSVVPDSIRPFLQFWVKGYPGTVADVEIVARFSDPNVTASLVAVANLELAKFTVEFNESYTCPTSRDWRRFRVSMEPLLEVFENTQFTSRSLVRVTLRFHNAIVAVDNVELVGPRLANDSQYSDRFVSISKVEIPSLRSYLGSDPVDTFFFVMPLLSLICCIVLVVLQCFSESRQAARAFVTGWAILGILIAGYAVLEYFSFLEALETLDLETRAIIEDYEVARTQLNPREVRSKVQGEVPFGFTRIALPKLNRSSLEKLFVFPTSGSPSLCKVKDGSTCANTTDEFFDHLDLKENETFSNLRLEADVALSQEHFLPILLASLILDIATSFVQVVTILVVAACRATSAKDGQIKQQIVKILKFTARFLTLIGVGLTITLVGFVIFDPIRYDIEYGLLESTESVRIPVTVRSGLEVLDSLSGKLFIDSSSLGMVKRLVNTADAVTQQPLTLSFAERQDEVYSFYRVETEDETCDWEGYTRDFTELSYSLDCSKGIIPIVSESSVKPYIDFAYDRIIFNLVVIDLAITLVDILIVSLEAAAYADPESKVIDEKAATVMPEI